MRRPLLFVAQDTSQQAVVDDLKFQLDAANNEVVQILLAIRKQYARLTNQQRIRGALQATEELAELNRLARALSALIDTFGILQQESLSSSFLCMTTKKLNTADIVVLTEQFKAVDQILKNKKAWCPDSIKIEADTKADDDNVAPSPSSPISSTSLSERIAATARQEYEISQLKLLLRRLALLMLLVMAAGIGVAIATVLFSVGIVPFDPSAILGAITSAFLAIGAIFGGPQPVTNSSINIGGMTVPVSVPVSITLLQPLQLIATPIMLRKTIAKHTVHPTREAAAVNAQAATVQLLIEELSLKVKKAIFHNEQIKRYMQNIINQAIGLYQDSTTCILEGSRRSRTTKARLILFATAKILENNPQAIVSIQSLLDQKIENYVYGQIINANRNMIWSTKTKTASVEGQPDNLTFGENVGVDAVANQLLSTAAA